jgi:hypothetical protein
MIEKFHGYDFSTLLSATGDECFQEIVPGSFINDTAVTRVILNIIQENNQEDISISAKGEDTTDHCRRGLHNYIKPVIMSYRRRPVFSIINHFLDSGFHRNDE